MMLPRKVSLGTSLVCVWLWGHGIRRSCLAEHPDLEDEDIRQALHYAAEAVSERELPLCTSA
ncbi:MAG: hypothetical protein ABSD78_19520 [Acidimicrobiales bacterium]|jgi:uncharacterized protein (DUF433 family)